MHEETHIIYNTIKRESKLTDEQLKLIGVNKNQINKAVLNCLSKGMTRKQAAKTILTIWKNSNPDVQASSPTAKEMDLMGFTLKDNTWTHTDTKLSFTTDQIRTMSFKDVEQAVFKAAHDIVTKENAERPASGDNETK